MTNYFAIGVYNNGVIYIPLLIGSATNSLFTYKNNNKNLNSRDINNSGKSGNELKIKATLLPNKMNINSGV